MDITWEKTIIRQERLPLIPTSLHPNPHLFYIPDEIIPPLIEMTNGTMTEDIKMRYVMGIYIIIIVIMGITILSVIGITGYILIQDIGIETAEQASVPDGLIAIGSAAVGALAGLLVPSPRNS
jgi:hypothetical protein